MKICIIEKQKKDINNKKKYGEKRKMSKIRKEIKFLSVYEKFYKKIENK